MGISASFDESWFSAFGTPIDMYFVSFGSDLVNDCSSFQDGICNSQLNNLNYQYDGGDCCAATCTNDNCKMHVINKPFGVDGGIGNGFPQCKDREMSAITIRLDDISISSHGSKLLINCDERDILDIIIDDKMRNKSEKIWVKEGNCTVTLIRNTRLIEPDWSVGLTVLHESNLFMKDTIVIVEDQINNVTNDINFKRIPDCYFRKLNDDSILYPVNKTVYTDNKQALKAVYHLMEDGDHYDAYCYDDLLVYKYEKKCNETFLNDGYCNLYFNTPEYNYDGGDCCGATCHQLNCGIEALKDPFGKAGITGVGFPDCIDPNMVPITVLLENVTSNFNLKLVCDEMSLLSINVDKSMENKTETVMTNDGAGCTLSLTNATTYDPDWFNSQAITVLHGNESSVNENSVVIHKSNANDFVPEQGYYVDFQRIPKCFFNPGYELEGFNSSNMYKDNDPSYKAIKSMMYEGDTNCDDVNFHYKYSKALFNNNCSTITDIICDDEKYGSFSTLCTLVSAFDDLYSKLSDEKIFWTVFAPTDNAFKRLKEEKLYNYNLENMKTVILNQVLRFHLVYGNEISREDLICSEPIITMFNGQDSRTQCKDGDIPFGQAGRANDRGPPKFTTETNIKACNGAIHSVDQVLLDTEPNITNWLKPTMQPSVSPSALPSVSHSMSPSFPPSVLPFRSPSVLPPITPIVWQNPIVQPPAISPTTSSSQSLLESRSVQPSSSANVRRKPL